MLETASKTRMAVLRASAVGTPQSRHILSLITVAAVGLLSACTMMQPRDSVTVGAIPDDYRTNHPIVIAEKEKKIDLPVGAGDRGATRSQRVALGGFFSDYDRSAAPVVGILIPSGSLNEVAASDASKDFVRIAKANGVPARRIVVSSYQAPSIESSAPVRITYSVMKAQTDKCGRWPADIMPTEDNKHYANFGCSYQNNVAAQLADPADLLGPRKQTSIDAENRSAVIDDYRLPPDPAASEVDY